MLRKTKWEFVKRADHVHTEILPSLSPELSALSPAEPVQPELALGRGTESLAKGTNVPLEENWACHAELTMARRRQRAVAMAAWVSRCRTGSCVITVTSFSMMLKITRCSRECSGATVALGTALAPLGPCCSPARRDWAGVQTNPPRQ